MTSGGRSSRATRTPGERVGQRDGGSLPRWRQALGTRGDVTRTSANLMLSTAGTAVLGLAFWAIATHLFPARAIGVSSAQISAMSLLAGFAQLNLAAAYVRFLPVAGDEKLRAIRRGSALSLVTATVVGTGFLFMPQAHTVVSEGALGSVVFALSVPLWTIFVLQDGVLTGLRRAHLVPWKNIGFSAAKVLLLPLFAVLALRSELDLFVAWTLPVLPAAWVVGSYVSHHARRHDDGTTTVVAAALPSGPELRSFLSAEFVLSLITSVSVYVLPLVVEAERGAVTEAHFYIPWLVFVTCMNLLVNVSSGLVADMAAGNRTRSTFRRGLVIMGGVAGAALVVCTALPRLTLSVFSTGYATSGALTVLRYVGLSMPFGVLLTMLVSLLWIEQRIWALVAARLLQSIVLVGGAALALGHLGISGIGIAILASNGVVAAASLPVLVRWYRRTLSPPPPRGEVAIVREPPSDGSDRPEQASGGSGHRDSASQRKMDV